MSKGWVSRCLRACVVAGAVTSATACGPVAYYVNVASATEAVEEARQAGAEAAAPYEYFYAQAYLDKAREEAGQAEYQHSIDLANTATEFGQRARDLARRRGHESGR